MRVRAPGKRSRGPAEVQQTRAADAQSRRRQLQWLCVLFHYVCVRVRVFVRAKAREARHSGAMSPNRRRRNIVRVHTIIISRGNRPRFAGKTVPGRLPAPHARKRSRPAAATRIIIIIIIICAFN